MTKAERIRQLAKHGIFSDDEIRATIVKEFGSCGEGYVRTVARQRVEGRSSENDHRYERSALGKARENRRQQKFFRIHGVKKSTFYARRTRSQHPIDRTSASPDARGA